MGDTGGAHTRLSGFARRMLHDLSDEIPSLRSISAHMYMRGDGAHVSQADVSAYKHHKNICKCCPIRPMRRLTVGQWLGQAKPRRWMLCPIHLYYPKEIEKYSLTQSSSGHIATHLAVPSFCSLIQSLHRYIMRANAKTTICSAKPCSKSVNKCSIVPQDA